jgi:hypothetical protein
MVKPEVGQQEKQRGAEPRPLVPVSIVGNQAILPGNASRELLKGLNGSNRR